MDANEQTNEETPVVSETAGESASANANEKGSGRHLYRSSQRKLVGGVAGGLSERFDVDANIVRVIFVVLTLLWGLGAAVYLAMWVLIPKSESWSNDASAGASKPDREESRWMKWILLAGVLVVGLIIVATVVGASHVGGGLALVWLVFLVVLAVIALNTSARRHTLGRFFALVFLVVLSALILLSGAFLALVASTGVPMTGGIGLRIDQPTSIDQLQRYYRTDIGSMTIDLSQVPFTSGTYDITATVAVGKLQIDLPSNVIVDVRTHTGVGAVTYNQSSVPPYSSFTSVPPSLTTAASQAKAPHIVLNAQVGVGVITLQRGPNNPSEIG